MAMDAPAKLIVEMEVGVTGVGRVTVNVPPQTAVVLAGAMRPAGSTSVNAMSVIVVLLLGFVIVKTRVAGDPPTDIVVGVKAFVIVGGSA